MWWFAPAGAPLSVALTPGVDGGGSAFAFRVGVGGAGALALAGGASGSFGWASASSAESVAWRVVPVWPRHGQRSPPRGRVIHAHCARSSDISSRRAFDGPVGGGSDVIGEDADGGRVPSGAPQVLAAFGAPRLRGAEGGLAGKVDAESTALVAVWAWGVGLVEG